MGIYNGQYLIHTLQKIDDFLREKGKIKVGRQAKESQNSFGPSRLEESQALGKRHEDIKKYMDLFATTMRDLKDTGAESEDSTTYYPFDLRSNSIVYKMNSSMYKMPGLISRYFENREFLYFQLWRWNCIDDNVIQRLEDDFRVDYAGAWARNIEALNVHSISAVLTDTKELLDTYFDYYCKFTSEEANLAKLKISVKAALDSLRELPPKDDPQWQSLETVWNACYSFEEPTHEGAEKDRYFTLDRLKDNKGELLKFYQHPNRAASFDEAFEAAFPAFMQRREHARKIMARMPRGAFAMAGLDAKETQSLLMYANPVTPNDFERRIGKYPDAPYCEVAGLESKIAYLPLWDADETQRYTAENFEFKLEAMEKRTCVDPLHPFEEQIDELATQCEKGANRAGFWGPNEKKIFIRHALFRQGDKTVEMRLGAIPVFMGDARLALFTKFLYPGNEDKALHYLKEKDRLTQFMPEALHGDSYASLKEQFRNAANAFYKCRVADTVKQTDDAVEIHGDGIGYMGCGTFILTGDTDGQGGDRPFLLLELRRRVTQEAGGLGYPSAGSCDLYEPYEGTGSLRPPIQPIEDVEREKTDVMASPFVTIERELLEELALRVDPDKIQLISFGIDTNRNLQQFSFLHESPLTAKTIMNKKKNAEYRFEGSTFAVPFCKKAIMELLRRCQLEPAAVYSLLRVMDLKKNRLWDKPASSLELRFSVSAELSAGTKIEEILLEALRSELKQYGCSSHAANCAGCEKAGACPYYAIFGCVQKGNDQLIAISRIDKGDEGNGVFRLSISLFGSATEHIADVISAVKEACKDRLNDVLGEAMLLTAYDLAAGITVYDWQKGLIGMPVTVEQ